MAAKAPKANEPAAAESAILASIERSTADGRDASDDQVDAVETEELEGEILTATAGNLPAVRGPASDREIDVELPPASQAAMAKMSAWLEMHEARSAHPDAAVADIIRQVLDSQSVDEVLADVTAKGFSELLDVPVRIFDGKFNRSDYEAGQPWYALLDVQRLDNNWRGLVTTGAQSVLAQLVRLIELGAFPCDVRLVYATKNPTKNGYRPVRLAKA